MPALLITFINAWWIVVTISHNKEMEYLNNPTPEVARERIRWIAALKRLQAWSSKRWGADRVGKMIFDRERL